MPKISLKGALSQRFCSNILQRTFSLTLNCSYSSRTKINYVRWFLWGRTNGDHFFFNDFLKYNGRTWKNWPLQSVSIQAIPFAMRFKQEGHIPWAIQSLLWTMIGLNIWLLVYMQSFWYVQNLCSLSPHPKLHEVLKFWKCCHKSPKPRYFDIVPTSFLLVILPCTQFSKGIGVNVGLKVYFVGWAC